MIAYASLTGSSRNLRALRAHGWRLMVAPTSHGRPPADFGYALDNGAWTAHRRGEPFDEPAFAEAYEQLGAGADFTVLPDIVAGGRPSLDFSMGWLARIGGGARPLMLAVQDGMTPEVIAPLVGPQLGIFIGGSTEWKLATARTWGLLAIERAAWCHMGRVNSIRRIGVCLGAGVHSFDGSSASRFAVNVPMLDGARRQGDFRI